MKTTWNSHRLLSIALLATVALPSIGCKTASWKMPGSSWFSSNREPDASLLAGENGMPQYPESPAAKYEPNTVASVGAQSQSSQSPGSQSPGSSSLASTTAKPGSSLYGASPQAVDTPRAGLAAQANGYQTGPYQTRPTTPPANNPLTAGLPNPYGGSYAGTGSYAGSGTGAPDITLPTSVANAWSTESAASPAQYPGNASPANPYMGNQYTGTQGPTANTTTVSNTKSPPISSASFPSYPPTPGASGTMASGTLGLPNSATLPASGYGTSGAAPSMPALPNFAGSGNLPTNTPQSSFALPTGAMPSSSSTGAGSANAPVPSAYKGATTLSGYSPGTTSRSTGYDFGNGPAASASAPYPTSPSLTLPPNTANGSNPLLR